MSIGNRLENKIAIITGGIGETIARTFLDQGGKIMLVGRSQEKLNATIKNLGGGKNVAHAVAQADN